MKMTDDFYKSVDEAEDFDAIEGLLNFDECEIQENAPVNPEYAYAARALAIEIPLEQHKKAEWQHYWFRCCISDKCNYIFSILKSKDVDREEDLKKICNCNSELWKARGDDEMRGYVDVCIDFFLKRYNWTDAYHLYRNNSPIVHINAFKLLFPRLFSAILVGFLPIATSYEIQKFAEGIQSDILVYPLVISVISGLSISYLLFECHKTIRGTAVKKQCSERIAPVLAGGLLFSLFFSCGFTIVGFLGEGDWCLARVIFYAMFAFLVGILLQLLWEEKTVTEPL